MNINQQTLAELLQLGGQYFLPVAALLRALYSGARGKLPEGFTQILAAAVFAGVTAGLSDQQPDIRGIALQVLGNTTFTAGVLSFVVLYLLRMQFRGLLLDGIVGAALGLIIWLVTVYVFGEPWPWWLLLLIIPGGALGFIALRFALRQIVRLVRIATWFIVIGLVLVIGAGGFLLVQSLTQTAR